MNKKQRPSDSSTVRAIIKIDPSAKYIILANVNVEAMDDDALEKLWMQLIAWWQDDRMPFIILNEGALKLVKIDGPPEIIRGVPEESG